MKKFAIACIVLFLLLILGGGAYIGYTGYMTKAKDNSTTQDVRTLPPSFTNPFVDKPATGFANTAGAAAVANLFTAPTPTAYENPFAATDSANLPYQNPFEQLQ